MYPGSGMHVLWKKRTHATNRQMGEPTCPHFRVRHPVVLTPVLNFYDVETRKYRYAWRIGPGIRQCCLNNGLAQAAWWWEVDQRFKDLARDGLEDKTLEESLLESRRIIEDLLRLVVPKPCAADRRKYQKLQAVYQNRRRVRLRIPSFAKILGVEWPCSMMDLKLVWKRLALKHHPDRGGNQEEFIRIKTAYEAAIQRIAE